VLHDGLADALGNRGTAGDRDTVGFGLGGDDVDEIVVGKNTREFEQRGGDLKVVVGELHHDVARRALQWRQQLGDVGPCLLLDEAGQLAQNLVVLGDLLVIDPVGHVGVELRHVAEQHVPFHVG
jgi:hypothetical protein